LFWRKEREGEERGEKGRIREVAMYMSKSAVQFVEGLKKERRENDGREGGSFHHHLLLLLLSLEQASYRCCRSGSRERERERREEKAFDFFVFI
jgi:hypothetical protein